MQMTNGTQNEAEYDNEYERKRALLRQRELTDEEAERIADVTGQKDSRDRYERKVVPVSIEDGEVEIGSVYRIAGNENVRWNDEVVGTFGGGGTTAEEVQRAFREGKRLMIDGLHDAEMHAREFGDL